MKKIMLVALITMFTFVGKAYAEMSYGVSLALTEINASGTETEGTEQTNADADNSVVVPSLFAEYAIGNLSIGLDYVPLAADVSKNTKTRNDVETSVSGTAAAVTTSRTNKAQVELENHTTLYLNYMYNDMYYLKAGMAFVTLNTTESLELVLW